MRFKKHAVALFLWSLSVGKGQALLVPPVFERNWTNLTDIPRFYVQEAEYLLEVGDLEAASLELQQALALVPDHPTLLNYAADLYTRREQYALAEIYWARLSELFPSNAWVYARWGEIWFELGRPDEARKAFVWAHRLAPQDTFVRFHLAALYLAAGRAHRAKALLETPSLTEVAEFAGLAKDRGETVADVLGHPVYEELCRIILNVEPELGTNLASQISCAERVNVVAERLPRALQSIADQRWTEALEHMDAIVATGLQSPLLEIERARVLLYLGDSAEALRVVSKLVRQRQRSAVIYRIQGAVMLQAGRAREAIPFLERAMEQDPTDVETPLLLLSAYATTGRYTDARDAVRRLSPAQRAALADRIRERRAEAEVLWRVPDLCNELLATQPAEAALTGE